MSSKNRTDLAVADGSIGPVYVALRTVIMYQSATADSPAKLRMVSLDGAGGRELASGDVEVRQTGFDQFAYRQGSTWNLLSVNTAEVTALSGAPTNSSLFIASPSGRNDRLELTANGGGAGTKLWVQRADGSKQLLADDAVRGQVRFLTATTVLYRVGTSRTATDYVVSIEKPEPKLVRQSLTAVLNTPQFFNFY